MYSRETLMPATRFEGPTPARLFIERLALVLLMTLLAAPAAEAQSLTITGTVTAVSPEPINDADALGIRPGDTFTFTFNFPPGTCNSSYDGCSNTSRAPFVGQVGPVDIGFNWNSSYCQAFPTECGYYVGATPQTAWWVPPGDLFSIDSAGGGFITNSGVPVQVRLQPVARNWFGPIPFPYPPTSIPATLERDFFWMSSSGVPGFTITGRINCFVNCVPLTIRTTSLLPVQPGQPYQTQLRAVGGTGNYSWFVDGLPPGVGFTTAGHIFSTGIVGVPGGTYQVHIEVRDNGSGEIRDTTLPLVVTGCSAWVDTPPTVGLVTLNYQGTGGPFRVVLGNGSSNQCQYSIASVGVYPGLFFADAGGNDISHGNVGQGLQLSVHISSPQPNPLCAFRYVDIPVTALDVVTRARVTTQLRAEWAPRPLMFLPNGTPFCQPSRTVGPPNPTNYQPGQTAANGGVRG